jgi:(5-formylfuran-3-yl)methyl phosphate synthase
VHDLIREFNARQPGSVEPIGPDQIFVRDWTAAIPVGAYSHERAPQRVSFTVEVDLAPANRPVGELRDVVSYDLITDAIARATTAHVELVETLAETIARSVLAHPRVRVVDITVEKLDLGPGRVGCRLRRGRKG